jgi:hypothetical protein
MATRARASGGSGGDEERAEVSDIRHLEGSLGEPPHGEEPGRDEGPLQDRRRASGGRAVRGLPARNWVWRHSIGEGHARHWILDDNIDGFFRFNRNLKVKVSTGATFAAAEDFVDRYANVPMSGMNYFMFVTRKAGDIPPVYFNTRVYSCILLSNSPRHRLWWRGRYNEDTDLSLRFLKAGHCTILFNAFLALKQQTMTMRGGNTEDLYRRGDGVDGRLEMARSLQRQHPDVVRVTQKWGRWQHQVDYKRFKGNKLIRVGAEVTEGTDDYGMRLVRVEPKGKLMRSPGERGPRARRVKRTRRTGR